MSTPSQPEIRLDRLFLRDAVAILPGGRRDLVARLVRGQQLARMFDLNLEITLDARSFAAGDDLLLRAIAGATGAFPRVIYHLHTGDGLMFGDNPPTRQLVDFCARQANSGSLCGVCVHPDLVADHRPLLDLASDEFFVAAEVLDEECCSFNTFAEIENLLERHDDLTLVLDTAHIAGMEPAGEPPLARYCAAFAPRIVEVHISGRGNAYAPDRMPPGFATNHSLLSLGEGDFPEELVPLRELCGPCLTIEGVIPAGDYGQKLLAREVESFRRFLQ